MLITAIDLMAFEQETKVSDITRRRFIEAAGAIGVAPALASAQGAAALQNSATTADASGVSVEKDVVFGRVGDVELRLDVYRPPAGAPAKRMALIHLYGGGFVGGSKDTLGNKLRPFAARGYVAIASQYRLAGVAKWPAPLEDVKAAIRWTRANATQLDIDPARIGVVGYSAGGLLAMMAAGTQNRREFEGTGGNAGVSTSLAAAFGFYPAVEVVVPRADGTAHVLMPSGSDRAAHLAVNPSNYASTFPPTVLFHGMADTSIPLPSTQRLFEKLREANVAVELHTYSGVPHEFDMHPEFAEDVAKVADFFLERNVIHPKTYPPFGFGRRGEGSPR